MRGFYISRGTHLYDCAPFPPCSFPIKIPSSDYIDKMAALRTGAHHLAICWLVAHTSFYPSVLVSLLALQPQQNLNFTVSSPECLWSGKTEQQSFPGRNCQYYSPIALNTSVKRNGGQVPSWDPLCCLPPQGSEESSVLWNFLPHDGKRVFRVLPDSAKIQDTQDARFNPGIPYGPKSIARIPECRARITPLALLVYPISTPDNGKTTEHELQGKTMRVKLLGRGKLDYTQQNLGTNS